MATTGIWPGNLIKVPLIMKYLRVLLNEMSQRTEILDGCFRFPSTPPLSLPTAPAIESSAHYLSLFKPYVLDGVACGGDKGLAPSA